MRSTERDKLKGRLSYINRKRQEGKNKEKIANSLGKVLLAAASDLFVFQTLWKCLQVPFGLLAVFLHLILALSYYLIIYTCISMHIFWSEVVHLFIVLRFSFLLDWPNHQKVNLDHCWFSHLNPILHTHWLENHVLTLKIMLKVLSWIKENLCTVKKHFLSML